MKREEAIEMNDAYAKSCISFGMDIGSTIDCPIDKIYDDFESRVCENCKYKSTSSKDYKLYCNKGYIENIGANCSRNWVSKDFGCNKFEQK